MSDPVLAVNIRGYLVACGEDAMVARLDEMVAELAAAREREATLREALRAIANMAGAAGPGEVPAMPIARRARAALAASPAAEEPQP